MPLDSNQHVGLVVSKGIVQSYTGTPRLMLQPTDHFEPGDVMLVKFTDPSWTPLFPVCGAILMN